MSAMISTTAAATAPAVLPPLRRAYVAPSTGRFTADGAAPAPAAVYRRPSVTSATSGFNGGASGFGPQDQDEVPAHMLNITLHLVDPQVKSGKLPVTLRQTVATRGRRDWIAAHAAGQDLSRDVSVCCLFQDGRCKAAAACRQIHVDRSIIGALRAERVGLVTCCLKCGDDASVSMPEATRLFADVAARGCRRAQLDGLATAGMPQLKISQLGYTRGLQSLVHDRLAELSTQSALPVAWSSVCRLHLKAACKYGRDCKNLHLCSKIGSMLLSRAAANVNALVPENVQQQAEECANTSFDLTPAATPTATPTVVAKKSESAAVVSAEVPPPLMQPRAPAVLREAFPLLDEGSLRVRDADLQNLTFCVDGMLSLNLGSPARMAATPQSSCFAASSNSSPMFKRSAGPPRSSAACNMAPTPFHAAQSPWGASPQSTMSNCRPVAFGGSPMAVARGDLFGAHFDGSSASPQSTTSWRPAAQTTQPIF